MAISCCVDASLDGPEGRGGGQPAVVVVARPSIDIVLKAIALIPADAQECARLAASRPKAIGYNGFRGLIGTSGCLSDSEEWQLPHVIPANASLRSLSRP